MNCLEAVCRQRVIEMRNFVFTSARFVSLICGRRMARKPSHLEGKARWKQNILFVGGGGACERDPRAPHPKESENLEVWKLGVLVAWKTGIGSQTLLM